MEQWMIDPEREIDTRAQAAIDRGYLTREDHAVECRWTPAGRVYFSIRAAADDMKWSGLGEGSQDPGDWEPA